LSFWTKYSLETNYDYTYLQISTNGIDWTTLETFNGTLNSWTQKTYSLDAYLGEPFVQIRFRFTSDNYLTQNGMFIDDFTLNVEGTGTGSGENLNSESSISIYPNPVNKSSLVTITGLSSSGAEISIYSPTGVLIEKIIIETQQTNYSYEFHPKGLNDGIYYCVIQLGNKVYVKKLEVVR
jgi:carboxypeptidase T